MQTYLKVNTLGIYSLMYLMHSQFIYKKKHYDYLYKCEIKKLKLKSYEKFSAATEASQAGLPTDTH